MGICVLRLFFAQLFPLAIIRCSLAKAQSRRGLCLVFKLANKIPRSDVISLIELYQGKYRSQTGWTCRHG
ncbi:MAG: hypothetical protein JWQ38_1388 [Flavipsychrobacter sp.]|nr:hypothetical protein [Flavipsychrobacter sp.]